MSLRPPWEISRTVIVRAEEEADPSLGCLPEERPIDRHIRFGVINLDKPPGPTSHEVVSWVKRILGLDRAGHGGTLDPKVTGVLPITLAEATKVVQALLESGKEYICVMRTHEEEREERVIEALKLFEGRIFQRPPLRASVKRRLRTRTIYRIDYLEGDGRNWLFKVACESGTYIRKLCVSGDTELIFSNGEILKIENFANMFCNSIGSYNVDGEYRIISFDNGHQVNNRIISVQKVPSPKKIIKIITSSGNEIKLTKDHEVLESTLEGPRWINAGDIKEGDLIFAPGKIEINGKVPYVADLLNEKILVNIDEIEEHFEGKFESGRLKDGKYVSIKNVREHCDWNRFKDKINKFKGENDEEIELSTKMVDEKMMYLLGLLASGTTVIYKLDREKGGSIRFTNSDEDLIRNFVDIHKNLFPSISVQVRRLRKNMIEVRVNNPVLESIARSLGIEKIPKRSDPKPIFKLSEPLIKGFIRGYFDCGGSAKIYQNEGESFLDIELYALNKVIAKRLYLLLKRLGINSRIFSVNNFDSSQHHDKNFLAVGLRSSMDKIRFIREIGSELPKKKEILEKMEMLLKIKGLEDIEYCPLHIKQEIKEMLIKGEINRCDLNLDENFEEILSSEILMTKYHLNILIKKLEPFIDKKLLEQLTSTLNSTFFLERVERVEEIETNGSYVYDVTVEKSHNFIPEGSIVVSNCFDVGEILGIGAHMHELRRVRSGPFDERGLSTTYDLVDAVEMLRAEGDERPLRRVIRPMEEALRLLPKIWIRDSAVEAICSGASLAIPGILRLESGIIKGSTVAVLTQKGEGVALMRAEMPGEEMAEAERGIAATPLRVLMPRGTYPRMW